jgi:hypothetical protein
MIADELEGLKANVPPSHRVATGRGTERAFAQIIPPQGATYFAIADNEIAAMRGALAKMREARRHKSA